MDRFLLIIFCSVLLWTNVLGGQFEILWFVYAQTLAYGLTAALALFLMVRESGKLKLKFKPDFSRVILRNSFPYALLILLMMMYNRVDSVMIERLLPDGDTQAGIYAQGFRYLDAVNMFALLFAGMLLPVFARQLRANDSVLVYVELALRLLGSTSILVGVTAFLFADDLLRLRYGLVSEQAVWSFRFLILSFIPVSMTYIYGTLLTANGSLAALNRMALGGLLLNLLLNFIWIPQYGVYGAAVATLITQAATAIVQIFLVYRFFRFRFHYGIFIPLIFLAALIWGIAKSLEFTSLESGYRLICTIAGALILMFVLRLFRPADLKGMMGITREGND